MGTNTHCAQCGAEEDAKNGIVIGLFSELNEETCNICLSDWLAENTPLRNREADVYSLQILMDWDRKKIADFLNIERSTVDTLVSRITTRISNSVKFAKVAKQ